MDKPKEPPKIRVVVRKRPLFGKELTRNEKDILTVVGTNSLAVQEVKEKVDLTKYIEEHHFTFDNVFEHTADNQRLYEECVQPLVAETFKGAKTTCFAYGQTGSGKTFTMMGTSDGAVSGMYTLASYDIIELLEQYEGLELAVSFYEIYCGKLFDLLNKRAKVECREDSRGRVQIANLTEKPVQRIEEVMDTIHAGLKCRTSGTTGANAESSRSHAILTYFIKHSGKVFSKMSFIDLAGSERGADVIDTGKKTKQDGAEINKSLLALKECIRALDQAGKAHLPFRQSKLTQVLKDSFMGNSKTTMIANVSPALSCCEPTLNTLRYADRVKELKKDPKLKALQEAGGDALSKELMLARQNNNTKIIKLDQKTGRPVSEMQELGKDFKLTKKAPGALDPAELLARKQAKQQEQQPAEPSAPRQREAASPQKTAAIGRGIGSGIGGGTRPRPAAAPATAQRPGAIGQGRPQQNNYVGGADYDDEDELERVDDFEEENERYRTQQRQQQQEQEQQRRQAQRRDSRPQQPRLDEVQAAEDRLAALEMRLDSAENDLLMDEDDPFAAELAEPKRRPQQQQRRRQRDDYGDEDQDDDLLAEQHQRTVDGRNRARPSRRDEQDDDGGDYSRTLKNLGDGLATLQDKRDRARGGRHQTHDVQLEDVDDDFDARDHLQNSSSRRNAQYRERARPRDDSGGSQSENVPVDHLEQRGAPGHRRNPSGNPAAESQSAGFRSKLRAPTGGGQIGGGLKQPTQSSSSSQATGGPEPGAKKSMMQGLKSQVSSFKERLQSSKTNRGAERPNARDAMKKGEKKVLFGSMVETTSGGDDGGHLLSKGDRNPRSALKQPSGTKIRGMSQAPALGVKKLSDQTDFKKPESKLLQSRQNRYAQAEQNRRGGGPKRESLGDGVPTFNEVSAKYANNIEQLGEDHERIIEQILEEEEQLIFKHNTSCKQSIKIVEEEMAILKNVDKPGSDVESYVEHLDKILVRKIEMMVDLRRHVLDFYKNIKTEEMLAKLYQSMQESQEQFDYDDDDYMNQYGRPNM